MSKTNPYNSEQLAAFIEERVRIAEIKQLQFRNGAWVTSITEFLDDNPGAIEAITNWINENYPILEEDESEEDEV